MPRVAGQGLQGQRSGAKENAVDGALIPQGKWTELVRQRKDSVKVGDGQQLGGASLQPLGLARSLALGAMAVATGLVADFLVIALRALPQVTAQCGGATGLHVLQRFPLLLRDAIAGQEICLAAAYDVGHFGPLLVHLWSVPKARTSKS
mgnify:CR=1 FL=1